ncbi:actin cytoskeleton-regulatory complex protein pan1-like isoform X2 [Gouania willdenowi]|uniref:actin cytoskeleton-regulatory complex protein pan1-like isoform X2 n=1 Tax=Gouania willdenowi TaxID=441366 RepID=UPI001055D452|nr:actin cytoskeleton-regulatory complex protein pan1-like isoform X2 [Gouania willdenowi]
MRASQDMTVPTLEAEQALLASQASAAVPGSSAAPSPQATAFVPPIPPVIPLLPVTQSHVASSSASAAPSPAVTALLPHSTQTVSPAEQSTSAPSTDPSPHSSSCHDWVGPDNIEGYGAVQDLADYLAGLRDHRLALTQEECSQVIALWQELGEYDKKKTVYPARHQTSLSKGRFRATKKIVAPGVESTKRYCRRCKAQEQDILKQGLPALQAPMAAPSRLPPALQKGQTFTFGSLAQPHPFVLPPNTAGQAQLKGRPPSQPPPPPPPQTLLFFHPVPPAPPKPLITSPLTFQTQVTPRAVPYTTQQYRKRQMEAEQSGIFKRKYTKKKDTIVCSKCRKDRNLLHIASILATGIVKRLRLSPMMSGGLYWRSAIMAKSK